MVFYVLSPYNPSRNYSHARAMFNSPHSSIFEHIQALLTRGRRLRDVTLALTILSNLIKLVLIPLSLLIVMSLLSLLSLMSGLRGGVYGTILPTYPPKPCVRVRIRNLTTSSLLGGDGWVCFACSARSWGI